MATAAVSSPSFTIPKMEFKAKYTPEIEHLKPTTKKKILEIAYNVFSVLIPILIFIRILVKAAVFPAGFGWKSAKKIQIKENQFYKKWKPNKHFEVRKITVTTPDGVKIQGTYFKKRGVESNADTLIYFNANAMTSSDTFGSNSTSAFSLLNETAKSNRNCHFVTFDYRNSGFSNESSAWSKEALELDAESIYQFVRDELLVPEDKIHTYGHSLGGGISALFRKNHPEATGAFVSDRSFTSIVNCAKSNVNSQCEKVFTSFSIRYSKWNIDTENYWNHITGNRLVIYHPNDHIMKKSHLASLAKTNGDKVIDLSDKGRVNYPHWDHHCTRIDAYNEKIPEIVMDFILKT